MVRIDFALSELNLHPMKYLCAELWVAEFTGIGRHSVQYTLSKKIRYVLVFEHLELEKEWKKNANYEKVESGMIYF